MIRNQFYSSITTVNKIIMIKAARAMRLTPQLLVSKCQIRRKMLTEMAKIKTFRFRKKCSEH